MSKPNFLIFCVDQMQSYCLGCNGHSQVRTPNIDALAAAGISFTRGYCNNPVCSPSRATMVTGLTPRQHGLTTNGCRLDESVPTIGAAMSDAGYRTHSVGKLHLQPFGGMGGADCDSVEARQRWDEDPEHTLPLPYYGFQSVDFVGGHVDYAFGDYRRWLDARDPNAFSLLQRDNAFCRHDPAWTLAIPRELHYNEYIAERTNAFLAEQAQAEAPFFLWCSFPDPHHPFGAVEPFASMFDPADLELPASWEARDDPCGYLRAQRAGNQRNTRYTEDDLRHAMAQTFAMIAHIDACIGRVLAELERTGQADNTIVALVADHGEYLGSHGLLLKASWPWEESVRVPFVWRVPGQRTTGHIGACVSLLDLVPTIADYAELRQHWYDQRGDFARGPRVGLPGRSLRGFFDGADMPEVPALLEYDEDFHADDQLTRERGMVHGDWKLVVWAGFDDGLLVNLREDPHELTNHWDDPACLSIKADLLALLTRRLAATDAAGPRRICGA